MKRPTIPDLAKAAGVSVSTVNRVLSEAASVRAPTRDRVLGAAEEIGFYGLGALEHSVRTSRTRHRFGVLLLHSQRAFYTILGDAIREAAATCPDATIDLTLEFLDNLSPEKVADHIVSLGARSDAMAIVAPQHPLVADAIDEILAQGVPIVSLIGPLTAQGAVGQVGLDYWKVGRTAAWAFDKMVHAPGKIGILVGNHRLRNQEINESGFRSYFREHNPSFSLLEPLSTYESAAIARDHVEALLTAHPDLSGLFISGGGITGALAALRDTPKRDDFVAVGYELFDETRAALIDGTLSMVISHPMQRFAQETITALRHARRAGAHQTAQKITVAFDIHTSENV